MRLTTHLTLPILLVSLSTFADRSVPEIVQDGNRLLSEGSYNEAARAYGEAIGTYTASSALTAQNSTRTPMSTTTNGRRRTSPLVDIPQH